MNKLKKTGLTALAGTLVALSAAQAGGVSVNGTMELSYTKLDSKKVTGNPLGQKKNITFSGGGEFSNGWTYGITHVQNDGMSGMSSSSMNINMGGIITIAYDSGTGGYGANTVDNVVPTAWEEIDYGFSTGITDVGVVSKTHGVVSLTIKAPGIGTALGYSYANRVGAAAHADGAIGQGTNNRGHDMYLDLWNFSNDWFGIRTGFAAETVKHETKCKSIYGKTGSQATARNCGNRQYENAYAGTAYQTLKLGPLSAGYQATYKANGSREATAVANNHSWVAGVALTVGNYISMSYGTGVDDYKYNTYSGNSAVGGGLTKGNDDMEHTKFHGWSAAVNWGPLALKAVRNHVQNEGGKPDKHGGDHHQEINLSMAF